MAARRPLLLSIAVTLTVAIAAAVGYLYSIKFLAGTPQTLALTFIALISVATVLLSWLKGISQRKEIIKLCKLCGEAEVIYLPRRFSYMCRKSESLFLCYNSVSRRFAEIRVEREIARENYNLFDPHNFYCFKPIKGSIDRRNGEMRIDGEILFVDPTSMEIVNATARVRVYRPR